METTARGVTTLGDHQEHLSTEVVGGGVRSTPTYSHAPCGHVRDHGVGGGQNSSLDFVPVPVFEWNIVLGNF